MESNISSGGTISPDPLYEKGIKETQNKPMIRWLKIFDTFF